jgi:hypothetical protein
MQPLASFTVGAVLAATGYSPLFAHANTISCMPLTSIISNENENPHMMRGGESEPFYYKVDEANKSQHVNYLLN